MHSVPSAKGTSQSATMRPTTLRDARKLGLLPSVTNVLGVINKPELVEWKMTQAVLAALTLPRLEGEGEDAFAKRVVEQGKDVVEDAREGGERGGEDRDGPGSHHDTPLSNRISPLRIMLFRRETDSKGVAMSEDRSRRRLARVVLLSFAFLREGNADFFYGFFWWRT